jgi:choline dehydrogenase
VEDFNNLDQDAGVAPFPVNIDGATRINSAFAYIDPARDRLIVAGDAPVERVLIRGGRVAGLAVRDGQRLADIGASRVVLSAGAYGSPAILLRSGIGPAGELIAIGLKPTLDLPSVGRNLHDQPCLDVGYEGSGDLIQQMERHQAATGWQPHEQVIAKFPSAGCRQGFRPAYLPGRRPCQGHLTVVLDPGSRVPDAAVARERALDQSRSR